MFIDAHCHITGEEYAELGGVAGVLARAKENGVEQVICSGFDLDSSTQAAKIAQEHENVYFCAGFHPSELAKYTDGDLEKIAALCQSKKCVAVGEIGLDYHFDDNPAPQTQREMFIKQLQLAHALKLPVVIHSRDAAAETLAILREHKSLLSHGGLMHCYSYSPEMVDDFAALGLHFSFGGPCTFKNAKKVWDSVARVPAHRILSETDCPYLTPVPFRGTFPNEPKNVRYVVERIAQLKGIELYDMAKQIQKNTQELFFKG